MGNTTLRLETLEKVARITMNRPESYKLWMRP
jgi:hypothetical protein